MKKLRTIICIVFAVLLLATFAACGNNGGNTGGGNTGGGNTGGGNGGGTPTVMNPSVIGVAEGFFSVDDPKNIQFNMDLNTGSFESVSIDSTTLTRNTDYRFNIGSEILTFEKDYLATLSEGVKTFTFTTDKGSCDIQITIKPSLVAGYNMSFAKPLQFNEPDYFFSKVSRDGTNVTFDFLTYGDFTTEGMALKFVNLYFDMPAFNTLAANWRFNAEDVNIRVYSDGSVYLFTEFTSLTDNLWFHMDFNDYENGITRINGQLAYERGEKLSNVTITREDGVTKFSLVLSYEKLGINSTDAFNFYLKECSDANSVDFNLYEGDLVVDGKQMGNPERCTNWPTLNADGTITTP